MFGLHSGIFYLRRHRLFECNFDLLPPAACCHIGLPLSVYGHPGGTSCRDHQKFGQSTDWRIGMGIDWMTNDELAQAIPPAYTEYIGKYLLQEVASV
jgi:DNA (cytosine-5)-methyltransferase 1